MSEGSAHSGYATTDGPDNRILIRHLVMTLVRGWRVFAVVLLVTIAAAVAYLLLADPVFEAETTVIVDTDRAGDGGLDLVGFGAYRDVLVEVEVLRSLDMADRVARRIEALRDDGTSAAANWPVFEDAAEEPEVGLARIIQKRIEVEQVRREVGVIRVAVRSPLPQEAQRIANLYAEEYSGRNLETSRSEAARVKDFLGEQMDDRRAELASAETSIQLFKESENAVSLDREAEELAGRLADLQSLEDQALVELNMAEAELATLRREAGSIEPNLYGRVASGLDTEIAALQQEIARREVAVETKYGRNPGLRGNESSDRELVVDIETLRSLRAEVDQRARVYVDEVLASGGIDPMVAARLGEGASVPGALANISRLRTQITEKSILASGLKARLSVLRARISGYEQDLSRIPRQTRELASLERARQSGATTYEWLQQKYEEARVAEQSEFGYVRILDVADLPTKPVAPARAYTLILAVLLGLILGFIFVFGSDSLDDRVRRPEDARRFGLPIAGVIPSSVASARHAASRVAGTLDLGAGGSPVRSVMVTSCRSGEGRTSVATQLAAASAESERRTLLIDLDPQRPSVHLATGVSASPGLTNVLYQGVLVRDAIRATATPGLYVLPIGNVPVGSTWYPPVQELGALLAYLGRSFDRIVADASPILESGRVAAATALFERVLLVTRAGRTRGGDLNEAKGLLRLAQAGDVQLLVNGAEPKRSGSSHDARRSTADSVTLRPPAPARARPAESMATPRVSTPVPPFPGPPVSIGTPVSMGTPVAASIYEASPERR